MSILNHPREFICLGAKANFEQGNQTRYMAGAAGLHRSRNGRGIMTGSQGHPEYHRLRSRENLGSVRISVRALGVPFGFVTGCLAMVIGILILFGSMV